MNTKIIAAIVAIALAGVGGWWLGTHQHTHATADSAARKILYYQSTMHPWVKSDKPGNCTVCGMALVPVYEGSAGFDTKATTDLVMLPEGSPNAAAIRTAEVRREKLTRSLRFAGMIDDDDSRHRILSAYTGGRVEKLFVNFEGAEVRAGEPLALFYSRDLLLAAREYAVAAKLGNPAMKEGGEQKLRRFGLTPDQIAKVPARSDDDLFFELLSPISGTVVKRHVYEGQYVAEGEKLFEIADFTTMWLQFVAYEQDLPFLRIGQKVEVTTPSLPGKVLTSTLTFINPNLDEMTRSARVRVEIKNPTSDTGLHRQHELLHKTYAQVAVLVEMPETITVPRTAVLWPGLQPRVYVEKSAGTYQQRAVKLGRAGDDTWEVLEGLKPGERVVLSGNMLIDGQAQINSLAEPAAPKTPAKELKPGELDALRAYLTAAATLGDALAMDDLPAYRAALAKMPPAPDGMGLPKTPPAAGANLPATRKAFQPFSDSLAAFAPQVRAHFPELKIFYCPMSDDAAPGIPPNAKWIQLTAKLRNPYMGKDMLECGEEVK